jgi:hypothetical protein
MGGRININAIRAALREERGGKETRERERERERMGVDGEGPQNYCYNIYIL